MSESCINLDTSSAESSDDEALSIHSDDDRLSPGSPKRQRKATGAAVYIRPSLKMNGPRHGHSFVESQGMHTNSVVSFVQGILAVATWEELM